MRIPRAATRRQPKTTHSRLHQRSLVQDQWSGTADRGHSGHNDHGHTVVGPSLSSSLNHSWNSQLHWPVHRTAGQLFNLHIRTKTHLAATAQPSQAPGAQAGGSHSMRPNANCPDCPKQTEPQSTLPPTPQTPVWTTVQTEFHLDHAQQTTLITPPATYWPAMVSATQRHPGCWPHAAAGRRVLMRDTARPSNDYISCHRGTHTVQASVVIRHCTLLLPADEPQRWHVLPWQQDAPPMLQVARHSWRGAHFTRYSTTCLCAALCLDR
jgi:hypothetical protein